MERVERRDMATTTTKPAPAKKTGADEKKSVYCQLNQEVFSAVSLTAEREFRSVAAQMEMIATQWAAANAGASR